MQTQEQLTPPANPPKSTNTGEWECWECEKEYNTTAGGCLWNIFAFCLIAAISYVIIDCLWG